METTIICRGYMGIMEKKMETVVLPRTETCAPAIPSSQTRLHQGQRHDLIHQPQHLNTTLSILGANMLAGELHDVSLLIPLLTANTSSDG